MKQLLNAFLGQPEVPPKGDFRQLRQGLDRQPKCGGCRKIEALIQYWMSRTDSGRPTSARSKPELVHNNYAELDSCSHQCVTCRTIRRGLLMNQSTMNDVTSLVSCSDMVWATIIGASRHNMTLHISLSRDSSLSKSTILTLSQDTAISLTDVTLPVKAATKAVYSQIKTWAGVCHKTHPECGNLNWSKRNPTRLLHIISASEVQLVESGEDMRLAKYVALSYCWGSADDVAIQRGRTTDTNLAARKDQPFTISDLPATIRDAITLTRGCDLEYVWIDSVCIIQGNADDWLAEAHRMHEVYANAYFTICAVSVDTASAGLFHARAAWRYRAERCRLAAQRTALRIASCRDLVESSTWSNRAWTLQEEHLSPRIVYWTPQRVYWSCSKSSLAEGETSGPAPRSILPERTATSITSSTFVPDSSFLAASRSGQHLHERWYDLVESFTTRKLSRPSDKFAAISGIAMRYQHCRPGDQYMAGLWMDTFAQDLAWRTPVYLLEVHAPPVDEDGAVIPSWSWASLPLGHPAIMRHCGQSHDEQATRYHLVEPWSQDVGDRTVSAPMTRSVRVAGRMRPLVGALSERVDWSDISVLSAEGQEKFSFMDHVDDDIHSVDLGRGMILVYEAHRNETLGHIDYLTDADRLFQGTADFECLELGKSEMLLLEPCLEGLGDGSVVQQVKCYRRIGVSWKFRTDFFEGARHTKIELI